MKEKKSSRTAEGMAIVRAMESSRQEEKRMFYDPIALRLANPVSVFLSRVTIDSGFYAKRISVPGTIEFILSRERYIDDFLMSRMAKGLSQLVLLGAGFDTRAYRIPGIERVKVFEVDHPATQSVKLKKLKKAGVVIPENVTYVSIDFNIQRLEDRLAECGYDEKAQTLFIMQGVVMYLTEEGVDNTLSFIANHSGVGSSVIFDYFWNETLGEMRMDRTKKITNLIGESITFGINKGGVASFLEKRGFKDVHEAGAAEFKSLYFTGLNASRPVAEGAAIAWAYVAR